MRHSSALLVMSIVTHACSARTKALLPQQDPVADDSGAPATGPILSKPLAPRALGSIAENAQASAEEARHRRDVAGMQGERSFSSGSSTLQSHNVQASRPNRCPSREQRMKH
jgi:hypothetical protein